MMFGEKCLYLSRTKRTDGIRAELDTRRTRRAHREDRLEDTFSAIEVKRDVLAEASRSVRDGAEDDRQSL